jgi:hypothetical protein
VRPAKGVVYSGWESRPERFNQTTGSESWERSGNTVG